MCSSCNSMAVEDFYYVHDYQATRLALHNRDSTDLVSFVLTAVDLSKVAKVIIAPQKHSHARVVVEPGIRDNAQVISFSAISLFKEMVRNETYHSKASASIVLAYVWKQDIAIYEETDYGSRAVSYLIDDFQKNYIGDKSLITSLARISKILEELQKLSTMQTRLFIVHMSAGLGSLFSLKERENGMMSDGAWIIKEEMTSYLSSMEDNMINSLSGVKAIHPYVPRTGQLEISREAMNRKVDDGCVPVPDMPICCLHAHALDYVLATAVATERVGEHPSSGGPKHYSNFMEKSELANRELLKEILDSNFIGLSGEISSNGTSVTGYCINIFETVIEALPYNVPFEFLPFEEAYAEGGSYDDCIQQVLFKKFNATVVHSTMRENISLFIGFQSRPYSDGVVHVKNSDPLNCTTQQALFTTVSLVSLFWFVVYVLLYLFRNSIDNFWKRFNGNFHSKHGERGEARPLDGPNNMVSIDPDVFVKDSKQ